MEFRRGSFTLLSACRIYPNEIENNSPLAQEEECTPVIDEIRLDSKYTTSIVVLEKDSRKVEALWDTGATESYMDEKLLEAIGEEGKRYKVPIQLCLFDGKPSSAGSITKFYDTSMVLVEGGNPIPVRFNITKLSNKGVVIGRKWMSINKGILDLGRSTLRLRNSSNLGKGRATLAAVSSSDWRQLTTCSHPNNIPIGSPNRWSIRDRVEKGNGTRTKVGEGCAALAAAKIHTNELAEQCSHPISSSPDNQDEEGLSTDEEITGKYIPQDTITILAGVARELCEDMVEDMDTPSVSAMGDGVSDFSATLADEEDQLENIDILKLIPAEYAEYIDIFRPRAATGSLAPLRHYDMTIQVREGSKMPIAKLYQLTEDQRTILMDTLERELAAGRIRPSNSAYGSPTFFVPKKDGTSLRMVVDYRKVNECTIPDVYPLPLINQIYYDLGRSKYYSTFDLYGAYQLLRMKPGFEWLTAFRTQYGMFESLVVRDGLRNAPAVFQHFLNDIFRDVLGKGVVVYIDDIIAYSDNLDELRRLTIKVFDIVRKAGLFLKAAKCKFEQTSVLFLGMRISAKGVQVDEAKVKGVKTFPVPTNLKESRSFIGLASYCRRFIPKFSEIAAPIINLTRKDVKFLWGTAQNDAFNRLKQLLTEAPIIAHYDPDAFETVVQTDASHYGWGFIITQRKENEVQGRPIAIESGSFKSSELNYTTTEKEFLAIVMAFRRNRHMLLQIDSIVLTDHLNLTYWMKPRQLNSRQGRWVEELSQFRFKVVYQPGKLAVVPDALSRRADYHPGKGTTTSLEHNFVQALPSMDTNDLTLDEKERVSDILAAVRETSPSLEETQHLSLGDSDIREGYVKDEGIRIIRDAMLSLQCLNCNHQQCKSLTTIEFMIGGDLMFGNIELYKLNWSTSGFLVVNDRVYIPSFGETRLNILKSRHDSPMGGHQGITKTTELVERDYIWKSLKKDVREYVTGCTDCQRFKTSRGKPHGMLKTLEVPDRPWGHLSMDFIEPLPTSSGFDSILVIVDRLTKWSIFIPTTTRLNSPKLAQLVIDNVISQHGVPVSIVSDRGSKFTSRFWRYVTAKLGIDLRLSTAFHPQTDGQTERVNQVLEQYLRFFSDENQDDWSDKLGVASFVYNNSIHSATGFSPFYANFGYHPRWVDEIQLNEPSSVPIGVKMVEEISDVHKVCVANIAEANLRYSKSYDRKHKEGPTYRVGDLIMLSMRNIRTKKPAKKLDQKYSGPYSITELIGSHACRLQLPGTMKVHDVFHVSLLKPFVPPSYPGQDEVRRSPTEIIEEDEIHFEIANILNSRINGKTKSLEYLIEWAGYEGTDEETSWEPAANIDEGSSEKTDEFHARYPDKPSIHTPIRRTSAKVSNPRRSSRNVK